MAKTAFIIWAERERQVARQSFEDYQAAAYLEAEEYTRGALLNARGKRAGIDPLSLFMGNDAHAYAYASEELIEHWRTRTRPVVRHYLRQMIDLTVGS